MSQGIPITTHDLLKWLGLAGFYVVFTAMLVHQWRHPEHVPATWFPIHEEPGGRTRPKRVRQLRFSTVVVFVALNAIIVLAVVDEIRH